MEGYATTVYVISDEVLRILGCKDDPQLQMSNAEIITFSCITQLFPRNLKAKTNEGF